MKAILISIHPKWVAKILNGQKKIEVRKTGPQGPGPFDVYIYCTKTIKPVTEYDWGDFTFDDLPKLGKIVAKCRCYIGTMDFNDPKLDGGTANYILENCCLTLEQARRYQGNRPALRLWHISDLAIFAEPVGLDEFEYTNPSGTRYVSQRSLSGLQSPKHPPQSWCYVEGINDKTIASKDGDKDHGKSAR